MENKLFNIFGIMPGDPEAKESYVERGQVFKASNDSHVNLSKSLILSFNLHREAGCFFSTAYHAHYSSKQ
jgi:hypothetical protein